MATADRRRQVIAAAFALCIAAAVGLGALVTRDDHPTPEEPSPVSVDALSIYDFATLEEMVAASDAIVVGEVIATEQGRLVGEPDRGGVISRLVTIRVSRTLRGDPGATVIMEEEGWLPDGTPLIVNGVAPSAISDRGVYVLDAITDAELPAFVVINAQGRFLDVDGTLRGGDQRDPLVNTLQDQTLDELIAAIAALQFR